MCKIIDQLLQNMSQFPVMGGFEKCLTESMNALVTDPSDDVLKAHPHMPLCADCELTSLSKFLCLFCNLQFCVRARLMQVARGIVDKTSRVLEVTMS